MSAHLEQANGITADKISFYGAGKTPLKATLSGNSWTIDLPAGSEGEEGIYAYYNNGVQTPTTVGKLQLVRYENQQEKVKVVLVGGASAPDAGSLQSSLNQIYGPSQTSWEVTVDTYSATDWDTDKNGLNAGDNATLSQYTSEMNALKRGYFQQNSQESNTYYVFVVAGFSPATVQGYMPRGRGVGFISSSGNLAHTLAHELGHGAFGLEHTFDEVPQGSTDNLMDYALGSRLTHWQWQQIQHPGIIISWFDDPQDAELALIDNLAGAVLGAVVEVAVQLTTNTYQRYLSQYPTVNKDVDVWKIKWWPDVAIASAAGFASSGAGSLFKFVQFSGSTVGKAALKLAVETSTDFLIGVASDAARKYLSKEDINWTSTLLTNLVSSATFGAVFNSQAFARFKTKVLATFGRKVAPPVVIPVYTEQIVSKVFSAPRKVIAGSVNRISGKVGRFVKASDIEERVVQAVDQGAISSGNPLVGKRISGEFEESESLVEQELKGEVGESSTTPLPAETDAELVAEVNKVGNWLNKLDNLGLTTLKSEVNLLDEVAKAKFLDDFAGASDDVLRTLNSDIDLIRLWKTYSSQFKKVGYVTETGAFMTCQSVLDNHPDGYLGNLIKKVMDAPGPTNAEQVLVGVTHPSFEGKVFMGRNFKSSESTMEITFKTETAHPLIRDRIKYMDFIRNSVTDNTGKVVNEGLANKLLDIDNLNKLTTAGRAGYHGEVRALSDALYELEKTRVINNETFSEFDLFIRNSSDKVMQRCPCCFHITQGVKVLGGK
ncbi:hypothetical protein [Spirosoma foliorum]|uniref:Uncharacterized protein n=1 Tax=Spirosoma foliorum TaxID=2710596 RepID=A0A7G5GWT3_9BACT|nr:hypothetical protein [Spirosoma foliorum]QMW03325.1 hypothetical protein H3H32_36650 [Spirosoma foliorum]